MKNFFGILLLFVCLNVFAQNRQFRTPAYPLITHDPYFSIWMPHENPTQSESMHWTQKPMPVRSMVRIDGKVYRLMGKSPGFVPEAKWINSEVLPTKTIFSFIQDGLEIELSFLSPLLLNDLDLVSRPLSYVSWEMNAIDGEKVCQEVEDEIPSAIKRVMNKNQKQCN